MSRSCNSADPRFRHEHLPLILYVPPAYLGHLSTQFFLSRFLSPKDRTLLEHAHFYAQLLFAAWYMLIIQAYRIRSGYVFALVTGMLLLAASTNEILRLGRSRGTMGFVVVYVVPLLGAMVLAVEAVTAVSKGGKSILMIRVLISLRL